MCVYVYVGKGGERKRFGLDRHPFRIRNVRYEKKLNEREEFEQRPEVETRKTKICVKKRFR